MILDALYAISEITAGDTWFWKALTWGALSISAVVILYFLSQIGVGVQAFYHDDLKPWWTDRRARRMQKRMAQVDAEMAAIRKAHR